MNPPRKEPRKNAARAREVALLLFGSGLSALVYQTAWQRELRLVFGSSTAASAAVLSIFIGGAGLGSLLFGRRSDETPRPLRLYGRLELAIAALAALSPFAIDLARLVYRAAGGTFVLGMTLGTALRLALAAIVIGAPTILMGGTLPAAARAAESEGDTRRRAVGFLYAANTLGAVSGAALCTLVLLERLGTRGALFSAALLNALVALGALARARRLAPLAEEDTKNTPANETNHSTNHVPQWFVLSFAAVSGFLFFWLELVWYRLLGPLLGGTVYTFGVILAIVLLGIGLGGLLYPLFFRRRAPSARALALTAALEALFVALPFALGDRLAFLALLLRPDQGAGLFHHVPGWIAIVSLMAFPTALVSGVQYPLLVALLGEGRARVGSHLGTVGAHNTLGAMVGSLAGGFFLIPSLGAIEGMRAASIGLLAMAAGAAHFARKRGEGRMIAPPVFAALAIAALLTKGPTAVLRHTPIGAGRVDPVILDTPAFTRSFLEDVQRTIVWQTEGRESSVAIDGTDGVAMVVNGKIDGNARGDASTQVMGGLLGALLHPDPKRAMVIGFGTGSSAGWLGKVPSIERVDVAELEPSMLEFGHRCAAVNESVLDNPKVRVLVGDAREILPTVPERYDVVFSEPSNPYRAGVASLFTQEYYRAVKGRLNERGLFLQWVQIYEIDVETLRTIYATLASVFPSVETWYLGFSDLALVASEAPLTHDPAMLGAKLEAEPYRRALLSAWRAEGLEGLFAHYVAGPDFARALADVPGARVNTDDRNRVEFGFARAVGNFRSVSTFFEAVRHRKEDRPTLKSGSLDFVRVAEDRAAQVAGDGSDPAMPEHLTPEAEVRVQALVNYAAGNIEGALAKWSFQEEPPRGPVERTLVAEGLSWKGDDAALPLLERHARDFPIEADVIRARYAYAKGNRAEAVTLLERAFVAYRKDPWPSPVIMGRALELARELGQSAPRDAKRLFEAASAPFSVLVLESPRRLLRVDLAEVLPEENACVAAFASLEPHPPWDERLLGLRRDCYQRFSHPLAAEAARAAEARAKCVGWKAWLTCL